MDVCKTNGELVRSQSLVMPQSITHLLSTEMFVVIEGATKKVR